KEAVETGGVLAGFGHDRFIASQQIDIVGVEEVRAKEQPEQSGPGEDGGEKALHGAIAAALCGPTRDAEHGDATGHGQYSQRDAPKLVDSRHRNVRLKTKQEW